MTRGTATEAEPISLLATNIKAAREAKGWTQRKLADLVGVDTLAVSRWERGVATPNRDNLQALAEKLDVTVGWLYTDHGRAAA